MSDAGESKWFKVIVFVSSGFFAGIFLANIIYYNKLRNGGTLRGGEPISMLWLNAVLFVVAIVIFVWALIRMVVKHDVVVTTEEMRPVVTPVVTPVVAPVVTSTQVLPVVQPGAVRKSTIKYI